VTLRSARSSAFNQYRINYIAEFHFQVSELMRNKFLFSLFRVIFSFNTGFAGGCRDKSVEKWFEIWFDQEMALKVSWEINFWTDQEMALKVSWDQR
jgi:hypothetical protein